MKALVRRDLTVAARRPGLVVALALYAAVGALFLHAWGRAGLVPGLPGGNLHEQLAILQRVLVVALAPWIAVRVTGPETRDDRARLGLLLNVHATQIERARFVSLMVWMLLLVLAGLPASLLAQQMSAATMSDLARGTGAVAGLAAAAAIVAIALGRWIDDAIATWTVAAGSLTVAALVAGRI
jgi:hypothetical protein